VLQAEEEITFGLELRRGEREPCFAARFGLAAFVPFASATAACVHEQPSNGEALYIAGEARRLCLHRANDSHVLGDHKSDKNKRRSGL
jgi:hypothetical protein